MTASRAARLDWPVQNGLLSAEKWGAVSEATEGGALGKKGAEERKRLLADAVRGQVVQGGRVESQSEFEAVLVFGQEINHTLHMLITLFTCGLWGLVWLVLSLTGGERRRLVHIDDYGNVLVQHLGRA